MNRLLIQIYGNIPYKYVSKFLKEKNSVDQLNRQVPVFCDV